MQLLLHGSTVVSLLLVLLRLVQLLIACDLVLVFACSSSGGGRWEGRTCVVIDTG
jgi:hypothetical protein